MSLYWFCLDSIDYVRILCGYWLCIESVRIIYGFCMWIMCSNVMVMLLDSAIMYGFCWSVCMLQGCFGFLYGFQLSLLFGFYWFCTDSVWILSRYWFCADSARSLLILCWFCSGSVWGSVWVLYWIPMTSV